MYEADPRHVEKVLGDWRMAECCPLTTPGAEASTVGAAALEAVVAYPLVGDAIKWFRGGVARYNYLVSEGPGIALATHDLCK